MFGKRSPNDDAAPRPPDTADETNTDHSSSALSVPTRSREIATVPGSRTDSSNAGNRNKTILASQQLVHSLLYERIDGTAASCLPREALLQQVVEMIGEIVVEQRLSLTGSEQLLLGRAMVDDMVGLGPLEELLQDESITDIMVNRPDQIYVEKRGKLQLTSVRFRDRHHVMNVAQRIVTRIGRRIDET